MRVFADFGVDTFAEQFTGCHWAPQLGRSGGRAPTSASGSPLAQVGRASYRRYVGTPLSRSQRWTASWKRLPHPVRWVLVATVGLSLVIAGIAMLVLPGPGIATIIAGLAVLATEFAWARVVLSHVKKHGAKAAVATKDTALKVVRRAPK